MTEGKRSAGQTPLGRYGHFGRLLHLARERAGLTQAQLARRVGVTQEAIAQLERSKHLPSLDTACELAAALHTSVDALMGRPPGASVVHYHSDGEVRIWVAHGGIVILGHYGPEELDKLMASWQRLREDGTGSGMDPGDAMGEGPPG